MSGGLQRPIEHRDCSGAGDVWSIGIGAVPSPTAGAHAVAVAGGELHHQHLGVRKILLPLAAEADRHLVAGAVTAAVETWRVPSNAEPTRTLSLVTCANAADRSRKSVFTRIAQTGDSGPQASPEPSLRTLDARALLLKVRPALCAKPANLSELGKRDQAWKRHIANVLPHTSPEAVVSRWNPGAQPPEV